MFNRKKPLRDNRRAQGTRQIESLESRQLMTTAMGVDSSFDGLYEIDLDTGAVSEVGQLHPDAGRYTTPVSMAIRPGDNEIFVINNSPEKDAGLSTVDGSTGLATYVGESDASSISFDDEGRLFGIVDGKLAKVDPDTGEAKSLVFADAMPRLFGLDFNPDDGNFYGVTGDTVGTTTMLKITPAGKLLERIPLSEKIGSVPGAIVVDDGVAVVSNIKRTLYTAKLSNGNVINKVDTDNSPQGLDILTKKAERPTGAVIGVDSSTDKIYTIDLETGVATTIGALHPDADHYTTPVSLAVRPSDDTAFVINNSPVGDDGLSTVNLSTGLATHVGKTDAESIAFDADDNLYGVVGGELATIDPTTGKSTKLGGDALPRLFGLDYNWDDGQLYGITGDVDGNATVLEIATDGTLIDKIPLDAKIDSVPGSLVFLPNGQLVVSNLSKSLFDVNLKTGHVSNKRSAERLPQGLAVTSSIEPGQPAKLVGDVDGDGEVGFSDFLIVSSNYGDSPATREQGDLDGDCKVGFSDFLLVSNNYGEIVVEDEILELLVEDRTELLLGGKGDTGGRLSKVDLILDEFFA